MELIIYVRTLAELLLEVRKKYVAVATVRICKNICYFVRTYVLNCT